MLLAHRRGLRGDPSAPVAIKGLSAHCGQRNQPMGLTHGRAFPSSSGWSFPSGAQSDCLYTDTSPRCTDNNTCCSRSGLRFDGLAI